VALSFFTRDDNQSYQKVPARSVSVSREAIRD